MATGLILTGRFFENAKAVLEELKADAKASSDAACNDDATIISRHSPEISRPELDAIAHGNLVDEGLKIALAANAEQVLGLLQAYHDDNAFVGLSRMSGESVETALNAIKVQVRGLSERKKDVVEKFIQPATRKGRVLALKAA